MISACSSFFVYVGGFLEEIATTSKISFVNYSLDSFVKGKSYFEMRTLSSILNLGFLNSRSGLLYRMDKVGILYILWYQVYRAISSRI